MNKRIFIALILIITTSIAGAQSYSSKDLIGRWQSQRGNKANVIFYTDSTGVWLDTAGLISNKFNYITTTQNPGDRHMDFKFTIQINRKNPGYQRGYIKFLNDSTFLIRINSWDIPKDADTSNKKVGVFTRIKHPLPGTEAHMLDYTNLLGQWGNEVGYKVTDRKLIFTDDHTVYYKDAIQLIKYKYVVDFSKQPIPLDFYLENKQVKQMFIGFYSRDRLRVETFKNNDRGDHFTVFGGNTFFVREK